MKLASSRKKFNNYKSDFPENTVNRIERGFKKLGLSFKYKQKSVASAGFSAYSGKLVIEELGFAVEGKGISPELAKASAYAEMAERFSAGFIYFHIFYSDVEKYFTLLDNVIERNFLRGFCKNNKHKSTDFEAVKQYFPTGISKKKYNELKNVGLFNNLVDIYCFSSNAYKKIPVKFIDMLAGSTGLASGNTMEEAITQATCEIFERYAASKIMSDQITCPTIDSDSVKDEKIQRYIKMLTNLNFDIIIKDFTLGNKVPVIGVLLVNKNIERDENELKKDYYYQRIDVGSHVNIKEAILRAFNEHLQWVTKDELLYRKQSDLLFNVWIEILGKKYKGEQEKFKYFTKKYDFFGDLSFLKKGKTISLDELKSVNNFDFLDDINIILDICKQNNWDFQVIDYTHRLIRFPVVRVVIPQILSIAKPFMMKLVLNFDEDQERFNFFYGIEEFYRYVHDDKWINNKRDIARLIENLETSLSKDLYSYQVDLNNSGYFYNTVNLFHVLAFSYLVLKKYDDALKYFKALLKLGFDMPFESLYLKTLYHFKYNPMIYQNYIRILGNKSLRNELIRFRFEANPFKQEERFQDLEHLADSLLININKSFSTQS